MGHYSRPITYCRMSAYLYICIYLLLCAARDRLMDLQARFLDNDQSVRKQVQPLILRQPTHHITPTHPHITPTHPHMTPTHQDIDDLMDEINGLKDDYILAVGAADLPLYFGRTPDQLQ